MVVVDYDELLDVDDLPEELAGEDVISADHAATSASTLTSMVGQPLEELERQFIKETLRIVENREEAAAMLGIGQRTLYRKIKEYGL